MIVKCGGVPASQALATNVREARHLLVVRAQDSIVAVGAIKKPQKSLFDRVSESSGFDVRSYDAELGYIAVAPQFRRRGFASAICDKLLERFAEPLFATTGHASMKKILSERRFTTRGKTWARREGGSTATLTLFIRS